MDLTKRGRGGSGGPGGPGGHGGPSGGCGGPGGGCEGPDAQIAVCNFQNKVHCASYLCLKTDEG